MRNIFLVALFTMIFAPVISQAKPAVFKKFVANYPSAKRLASVSCAICHTNDNDYAVNAYGKDLAMATAANGGVVNFQMVEALDSDKDGYTNIQEITADLPPGDATFHP